MAKTEARVTCFGLWPSGRIKITTKANSATIAGVYLERTLVALFAESSKDLLEIILDALCRLCQGLRRLRQFANLIFDTSRRLR